MWLQSRILRTLHAPAARARLAPIVAQGAFESRTALGREVCAQFGFVDDGWLGAVGFSASALRHRARDAWMGWSDAQRTAHLPRGVCLSRFLIRPAVRCRHLAKPRCPHRTTSPVRWCSPVLLGGYQSRKHDPPPGHQSMWRGDERLSIATLGYRIAEKSRRDPRTTRNE